MKKIITMVGIILFFISSMFVLTADKTKIIYQPIDNMDNIKINYDRNIISCKIEKNDNTIKIMITPVSHGKAILNINGDINNNGKIKKKNLDLEVFVHRFNIVTVGNYLGHFNGDIYYLGSFYIILFLILIYNIGSYLINIKNKLYSYENVRLLGLVIFTSGFLLYNLLFFFYDYAHGYSKSIFSLVADMDEDIYIFLMMIFPIVFITIILVMISNFKLLKREGKRWKNMLGIILGVFLLIATFILTFYRVIFISNELLSITIAYFIIDSFVVIIVYFECILAGTIVSGIVAAKHIPKFDKDAIIILGCMIKEDGSLTNLLKSRVDRALEFSKMQKESTGKDIFFVPSGGKGNDEVISEAEAMKRYLIEQGVDKKKILLEDKSTNTYQNMKFSNKIIQEKINSPKIAFSTTNYHVFRSGIIANKQNINVEGIGAKTKAYYWINAFIREFVATIVSEAKCHLITIGILLLLILALSIITFLSLSL